MIKRWELYTVYCDRCCSQLYFVIGDIYDGVRITDEESVQKVLAGSTWEGSGDSWLCRICVRKQHEEVEHEQG